MTLATGYACRIELDSICEQTKCRLTTFVVSYPRFVHAEMMTHRMFSRNSASSRAIPIEKMIAAVDASCAKPAKWLTAGKGMQPNGALDEAKVEYANGFWEQAKDQAVRKARLLAELGVAKEQVNRLLEPFLWHTTIITATDFQNFFKLRCHPEAQQEIRIIAEMMKEAYDKSEPIAVSPGYWHCPFVPRDHVDEGIRNFGTDFVKVDFVKFSAARCARVSYTNHEGQEDRLGDIRLFERLTSSGHWSPLEHVAQASTSDDNYANFRGWVQYRKMFNSNYVYG